MTTTKLNAAMKTDFARIFWGIVVGAVVLVPTASPKDATVATITALEKKWSDAEANNMPNLIAPLLADQAIFTGFGGRVSSRADFLAVEHSTTYTFSTVEDLRIRVFGDTAIASYLLHQKGTDKNGPFDRQIRETDTWVKMPSGDWQVVATHGTDLKKG